MATAASASRTITPVAGSGFAPPSVGFSIPSPPLRRGRSTSATYTETAEEELERLRKENQELRVEMDTLEAQVYAMHSPALPFGGHMRTKSSLLPSGKLVRIAPEEMAAMRSIFDLFDTEGKGVISAKELKQLHVKLGEPITDEEADDAVRDIGQGLEYITFESFCLYWDGVHPSQRNKHGGGPTGSMYGGPFLPTPTPMGSEMSGSFAEPGSTPGSGMGHTASSSSVLIPAVRRHKSLDERDRKRQWYQARFKFVKAKISNPAVGRIYTESTGLFPSLEYRVRFYFDDDVGKKVQISPWHDVPFKNPDGSFNMIVEIPKWSRRKFEIATTEEYNPIKQDLKNGVLREYTYGDMLFNYGAIPQTWENPKVVSPETNSFGDNDPIDIVDIGTKMWTVGSIVAVKVLGVLGMIDSGETDWKLIAINTEDPLAAYLNDIEDVEVHMPGAVSALHHWLRHYKMPILNEFAFEGKAQGRMFAERLVQETHVEWNKLIDERGSRAVVDKH